MTVAMAERVERPSSLFGPAAEDREGVSGGLTLDDLIVRSWEGLAAHAAVACPVCAGSLRPQRSAAGAIGGGRCDRCGTTLD